VFHGLRARENSGAPCAVRFARTWQIRHGFHALPFKTPTFWPSSPLPPPLRPNPCWAGGRIRALAAEFPVPVRLLALGSALPVMCRLDLAKLRAQVRAINLASAARPGCRRSPPLPCGAFREWDACAVFAGRRGQTAACLTWNR
jgi:hypothetical protein